MSQELHISDLKVQNGKIVLENLPFSDGAKVDVTISGAANGNVDRVEAKRLLRGSVVKYDDPFGPAAPIEDWEVLR